MKNHILVTLMQQLTPLTKEEALDIEESFPIKTVTKGTFLLKEGTISKEAYYIIKGCIRAYKLQEGEEKTTSFFTENQSVINFNSITNNIASTINFICEEETTIAILNAEKEKALYLKHPRFETFCRNGVEKMMGEKQEQQIEYISLKPENPNLINRVPQYQIASYLGIKPETLSRIRARLVK
jgi:CRP-like cAMP-binding protein